MGPFDCCTIPGIHFGPWQKFLAYTSSPSFTMHFFTCKSCFSFWTPWWTRTLLPISGYTKSNLDLGFLPNESSAGETPVDVWGVIRYRLRNLDTLVSTLPSLIFFMASLKVLTALSASPFEAGCLEPFGYAGFHSPSGSLRTRCWQNCCHCRSQPFPGVRELQKRSSTFLSLR